MSVHHLLVSLLVAALLSCHCCQAQEDDEETTSAPATMDQLKPVECISCDWISEDMTKTLFQLDSHLRTHCKKPTDVEHELSKLLKDNTLDGGLQTLLHELDQFKREPRCDLESIGKLTALEARLEEGEDVAAPHESKILSLYLEQLHLQLLQTCRQLAKDQLGAWKSDADLQDTRKTFVQFAEHLKKGLANYKAQNARGALSNFWFVGLTVGGGDESDKKKPEFEHGTDLMNRGKAIVSRGHLFEKVQSTGGQFFGPNEATCRQTLNKHLVQLEKLSQILEPLKWLVNYNPESFAHGQMADKDRKGRKLLNVMPKEQEKFLKSNKEVADWLALQGFLKRTSGRQEELCSALVE